ncbi:MAG TPA: hypothetical protein PK780_11515, partial [Prevotella sp.]|nr:hypothetical protein [Prevotella sp.]
INYNSIFFYFSICSTAIVFNCISKDSRHLIPQLVIFGYFAAIAAMVMVSVSNVFASSRMVSNAEVAPVDTVAPDAPSDTVKDKISFILSPNPLC